MTYEVKRQADGDMMGSRQERLKLGINRLHARRLRRGTAIGTVLLKASSLGFLLCTVIL